MSRDTVSFKVFNLLVVDADLHGFYEPPFGKDEMLGGIALLVGLQEDLLHTPGGLIPLHTHRQLHRAAQEYVG
jgi:hypothetical protein